MFGIAHFYELALVLILALVFFGPKRLPELGSSLGKGIREFRTATREVQHGLLSESEPAPTRPLAQASVVAHGDDPVPGMAPDLVTALPGDHAHPRL